MVISFILLGLFGLIFIGSVGLMIKTYIEDKKDTKQVEDHENEPNYIRCLKDSRILTIAALICLAVMMFSTIYISVNAAPIESEVLPETEVVETVEESTPAPDETSIPTTEETIPDETSSDIPSEPPSVPVTTEPVPVIDPDELEMLACVIYQEAGGNASCDNCRRYVADIVLNRVEHPKFPNTIHKVLTAQGQYGEFYWTGIKWPSRAKNEYEKEAVARAYRIAEEVLSGQHSELYGQGYIWQARFIQGTEGFWCCGHWYGR